jgi:hypothetical protein
MIILFRIALQHAINVILGLIIPQQEPIPASKLRITRAQLNYILPNLQIIFQNHRTHHQRYIN